MWKFLTNKNHREIEKYNLIVNKINRLQKNIEILSDSELRKQTTKLKQKLNDGNTLDDILIEAFATAKEATRRTIGLSMFDVQVLGSIILHKGKIAEMQTGEGKTIVSILPAYLNSLADKGVHIVTVNDYLAKRDFEWVGRVHKSLGLTVGLIQQSQKTLERQKNYMCSVTYVTNSELGFDYLRDNMAIEMSEIVQRPFYYGIIDEVDSILIDEARTPLIISGLTKTMTNKYNKCTAISLELIKNIHYEVDAKTKNITLTENGIIFCESICKVDNLYNIYDPWAQYIINALKAREFFLKDQHYIIRNDEIIIVDEFTGRIMEGRRWSDGLHQAIEAKENLPIQKENQTLASITYQNLFLLYSKLSGMTGTAKTEEIELDKIYSLEVISIPTNKPCLRKELSDLVYKNEYSKWIAIAKECYDMNKIGRPILIGTTSIEKSELLAKMLDKYKLSYNLLNAKPENLSREAEIIAQAGRKYAITISTNMAGRGTDIILGGNAIAITKLILINWIKETINKSEIQQVVYALDIKTIKILEKNKDNKKTLSLLQKIDLNKLDEYIEYTIHSKHSLNNEGKLIKNIYYETLKHYNKVFKLEKEEVVRLGGLFVIGTERHESRRIDNQLRGRAGRQGDSGSSRFFLSLDDHLLKIFGGEKIRYLMQNLNIDNDIPIESNILSKSLDSAQRKVESYFYDIRKQLFEYDEVINNQRIAIYSERRRILESHFTRDCIIEYGESTIDELLSYYKTEYNPINKSIMMKRINHLLNISHNISDNYYDQLNNKQLKTFLYEQLHTTYDLREAYLEQVRPGLTRQLEKYYLLQQIDKAWQGHLERMNLLKESIGWRSYGQQDPLIEYKNEAFSLFINMITYIRQTVIYLIMRSRLVISLKEA